MYELSDSEWIHDTIKGWMGKENKEKVAIAISITIKEPTTINFINSLYLQLG